MSSQDESAKPAAEAKAATEAKPKKKKKVLKKVLSEERLRRLKERHARRGVVYVSRIPPHMKPAKLRQLLSQYGEVGRVYCTPEDPLLRRKRKQHGGNTGKNFTEGWVEFEDKSVAKAVAAALHAPTTRSAGRRRRRRTTHWTSGGIASAHVPT